MTEFKHGDKVVATQGESTVKGTITDVRINFVDVKVFSDTMTLSKKDWSIERISPAEPRGYSPVIKFDGFVPVFKHGDKWLFVSTVDTKRSWEQLLDWVDSHGRDNSEFEVLYGG